MPFFSGGGGGGATFNGGTITQPLSIEPTDPALTALTIKPPTGAVANATDWIRVENEDGNNLFEADATGFMTVKTLANNTGFRVRTTAGGTQLYAAPGSSELTGSNGGGFLAASDGATGDGAYFIGCNAAPTAGQLSPGVFALWLDQTNGASKLMVKAKSADGTVVTGSLALT